MASTYIGCVIATNYSNQILMTIDPDQDAELDNPVWVQMVVRTFATGSGQVPNPVPVLKMVKVPRSAYAGLTTWFQYPALVASYIT